MICSPVPVTHPALPPIDMDIDDPPAPPCKLVPPDPIWLLIPLTVRFLFMVEANVDVLGLEFPLGPGDLAAECTSERFGVVA